MQSMKELPVTAESGCLPGAPRWRHKCRARVQRSRTPALRPRANTVISFSWRAAACKTSFKTHTYADAGSDQVCEEEQQPLAGHVQRVEHQHAQRYGLQQRDYALLHELSG